MFFGSGPCDVLCPQIRFGTCPAAVGNLPKVCLLLLPGLQLTGATFLPHLPEPGHPTLCYGLEGREHRFLFWVTFCHLGTKQCGSCFCESHWTGNSCFGFFLRHLFPQNLGIKRWGRFQGPKPPTNTIRGTSLLTSPVLHQLHKSLSLTPLSSTHHLLKQTVISSQTCPGRIPPKYVVFALVSPFYSGLSLPPLNCCHGFLLTSLPLVSAPLHPVPRVNYHPWMGPSWNLPSP